MNNCLILLRPNTRKLLLSLPLVLLFFFLTVSGVYAATVDKYVDRSYEFMGNRVHVIEIVDTEINDVNIYIPAGSFENFIIFNPVIDDPQAQAKIEDTLPTIRVWDKNGTDLKYLTEVEGQNVMVKVQRISDIEPGDKQRIRLSYDSYALHSRNGATNDMYIPSFAEDYQFINDTTEYHYNTKVKIPKEFGELNLIIPEASYKSVDTFWEVNFTQEELTGTISWIQIGTSQIYTFDISQPFYTTSTIPFIQNSYKLIIPRDIQAGPITQKVYYSSITPSPSAISMDSEGNLYAEFLIPANQTGNIRMTGYAVLSHDKEFNIKTEDDVNKIEIMSLQNATQAAPFWEVDAEEIRSTAGQLKGDESNIYEIVKNTYEYVVNLIDYSEVKRFGLNERQGALETLNGGAAVCMEYSDLFIALVRAQGVPARAAFGYGYDSRSEGDIDTAHQWAEIYLPSVDSWIGIDTTWGESGSTLIGGDINHLYRYVAQEDPQTPSPVEALFFGAGNEIFDETFTINVSSSIPEEDTVTQTDLLRNFPRQPQDKTITTTLVLGLASAYNGLDSFASDVSYNVLGLNETLFGKMVYFAVLLSPILIIVLAWLLLRPVLRRRKENKMLGRY